MKILNMKILKLAAITVSTRTIYRFNWLSGIAAEFLNLGLLLIFWNAALGASGIIGTYDFPALFKYYLLVSIMQKFSMTESGSKISEDILSGRLSFFLLKPFSYHKTVISGDLSDKFENLFQAAAMVIFYLAISVFFGFDIRIRFSLFIVIAVINGIVLTYLINYITGMIAFWTKSAWALLLALSVFARVFSGQMFPVDIVPDQFKIIFVLSPFYYSIFFPVFLAMSSDISVYSLFWGIGTGFAWIIFLIVLCRVMFFLGLKHYEATGI